MHAQLEAVALDPLDDGARVLAAEAVRAHACDAREVQAELQARSTVAHGRPRRELRACVVRWDNGAAVCPGGDAVYGLWLCRTCAARARCVLRPRCVHIAWQQSDEPA